MSLTVYNSVLTHDAILTAVSAAAAKANELGRKVCICVNDAGGNRRAFIRMVGAPDLCERIAENKAYTSGIFGVDTKQWDKALANEHPRVLEGLKRLSRFTTFGGGLPIRVDGELVGGIGVSGASENEDELCARAGLTAIGCET
jgi:uncharacterized protein GlcG (DUF336 family)